VWPRNKFQFSPQLFFIRADNPEHWIFNQVREPDKGMKQVKDPFVPHQPPNKQKYADVIANRQIHANLFTHSHIGSETLRIHAAN